MASLDGSSFKHDFTRDVAMLINKGTCMDVLSASTSTNVRRSYSSGLFHLSVHARVHVVVHHIMCVYFNVPLLHIVGLTVDNVRKALHGINWHEVGRMLWIPNSKLSEIEGEYRSDEEREVAVIRYWILRDPFASWRRIIERLEYKGKHDHAITLYHYSEELTGMLGALTIHLMHPNYCFLYMYMYVCKCAMYMYSRKFPLDKHFAKPSKVDKDFLLEKFMALQCVYYMYMYMYHTSGNFYAMKCLYDNKITEVKNT